ncbi:MBL fold metallo-hydrolase [Thermus hydrothermalis]|uniref:hypothetical protein n=1 Tax=Thermus hydrothermalis TaxID=2908148 RepID=UPI001FA96EA9|nr:hypothetical protein [Thermus hydrothermalis]
MKRFDLDPLRLTLFGGWGEIGGNQILLEAADGAVLLDFGKPFARWGRFFTGFLPEGGS